MENQNVPKGATIKFKRVIRIYQSGKQKVPKG